MDREEVARWPLNWDAMEAEFNECQMNGWPCDLLVRHMVARLRRRTTSHEQPERS